MKNIKDEIVFPMWDKDLENISSAFKFRGY